MNNHNNDLNKKYCIFIIYLKNFKSKNFKKRIKNIAHVALNWHYRHSRIIDQWLSEPSQNREIADREHHRPHQNFSASGEGGRRRSSLATHLLGHLQAPIQTGCRHTTKKPFYRNMKSPFMRDFSSCEARRFIGAHNTPPQHHGSIAEDNKWVKWVSCMFFIFISFCLMCVYIYRLCYVCVHAFLLYAICLVLENLFCKKSAKDAV